MKNLEKGLTRRELLGNSLSTAAGISLLGVPTLLTSSCAIEDWGYTFDLSRLERWQANLFLEAGKDYWGINEGEHNDSYNKVYFGETSLNDSTGLRARANSDWEFRAHIPGPTPRDPIPSELPIPRDVYEYTIIFNHALDWVDCNKGDRGADLFVTAGHEWGHIIHKKGSEMHYEDSPGDVMRAPYPDRCPAY